MWKCFRNSNLSFKSVRQIPSVASKWDLLNTNKYMLSNFVLCYLPTCHMYGPCPWRMCEVGEPFEFLASMIFFADCCYGMYQLGFKDWRSAATNTWCHQRFPPPETDQRQKVSINNKLNFSLKILNVLLPYICFCFNHIDVWRWSVFAVNVPSCLFLYSKPF